ncbi:hypothetical protein ABIB25_003589 [Nakamurella sp. UYEF19]|uniref:glycosyltransferase 87 family protein n=1 Tax=Nakamurella sp. UYEF19 TaxID=1756392 RepID=UPI0033964F5D
MSVPPALVPAADGAPWKGPPAGAEHRDPAAAINRARVLILLFAVPLLILKLTIAAKTLGTNDILHWGDFANGERQAGPVGIYALTFKHSFYNHPPLVGFLLWFVNLLQDAGISFKFTIRGLSCFADVGSAFVLFELLRRRRSLREATWAGVLLAVSPVLVLVSGFHGNTDPIFTFLTFLSLWLLVDRRSPACAGAAIALAVGIKIIPLVVIPALALYAWKQGRREFLRFVAAFVVVFGATWGPALIKEFAPLRLNVIGYPGTGPSRWGILQLGHWIGDPGWVAFLAGPGRSLVVVICAIVPLIAVWRRPDTILHATAWALIGFMVFAVSFSVQYTVWPLAASYLVAFGWATVYNVLAAVVLTEIYSLWNHGFPLYQALAVPFTTAESYYLMVIWLVLVAIGVRATMLIFPTTRHS